MIGTRLKYAKLSALETTEVVLLLRQHFDAEKGAYHDGWSDQAVADKVKVKAGGVEHIRTAHFGKLRLGPASNAELKISLQTQRMEIDALTEDMSKLRDDFVQLVTVVRYNLGAHDGALKSALMAIEKRYPQARGPMDGVTNTPRGSNQ